MRPVIKIGTSTLAYETGHPNIRHIENFCKVMSDFYITDRTPDAEDRLAAVKELAESTKKMLSIALKNLQDALVEIDSLNASVVMKSDE